MYFFMHPTNKIRLTASSKNFCKITLLSSYNDILRKATISLINWSNPIGHFLASVTAQKRIVSNIYNKKYNTWYLLPYFHWNFNCGKIGFCVFFIIIIRNLIIWIIMNSKLMFFKMMK